MSEYYKGLIEVCERFIARAKYHLIDNGESSVPMLTSDFEAMREVVEIAKESLSQPERPKRRCTYCKDGKTFIGQTIIQGNDRVIHKINYCPNCGAEMVR